MQADHLAAVGRSVVAAQDGAREPDAAAVPTSGTGHGADGAFVVAVIPAPDVGAVHEPGDGPGGQQVGVEGPGLPDPTAVGHGEARKDWRSGFGRLELLKDVPWRCTVS